MLSGKLRIWKGSMHFMMCKRNPRIGFIVGERVGEIFVSKIKNHPMGKISEDTMGWAEWSQSIRILRMSKSKVIPTPGCVKGRVH